MGWDGEDDALGRLLTGDADGLEGGQVGAVRLVNGSPTALLDASVSKTIFQVPSFSFCNSYFGEYLIFR
jgi:hypothetical protein